jgi:hypothetical protein
MVIVMIATFSDSGQTLHDFSETIYVHCPKCNRCAYVKRIASDEDKILADDSGRSGSWTFQRMFSVRKLSCLHCGYAIKSRGGSFGYSYSKRAIPTDPFFYLLLWLRTPCCGKILWAYNEEHVSFLERFIAAKQREKFNATGRIRNATMASRLPLWIKSAHNRAELLKGIDRLKRMLEEQ